MSRPTVGAVVLSMGTRPASSPAALESLLAQQGVDLDVVVVGNGWEPAGLPAGVRTCHLPENVGIPGGRNVGAAAVPRRVPVLLRRRRRTCPPTTCWRGWSTVRWPTSGSVRSSRGLVDPTGKPAPKRWVPRPGGRPRAAAVWPGLGGHLRRTPAPLRAGRRLARALLLRARGHRARLADLGRRLRHLVLRRPLVMNHPATRPPGTTLLLPAERPEPALGGTAEPAVAAGRRLRHGLVLDHDASPAELACRPRDGPRVPGTALPSPAGLAVPCGGAPSGG